MTDDDDDDDDDDRATMTRVIDMKILSHCWTQMDLWVTPARAPKKAFRTESWNSFWRTSPSSSWQADRANIWPDAQKEKNTQRNAKYMHQEMLLAHMMRFTECPFLERASWPLKIRFANNFTKLHKAGTGSSLYRLALTP